MFLIASMSFLMKWFSSSLFLMRNCFFVCIHSSIINMLTVIGTWLEVSLQSEWMIWLSNSREKGQRKTKSRTESKF